MKNIAKAIFLACILFWLAKPGNASPEVKRYDVFEIRLSAEKKYENPYEESFPSAGDALVSVVFTGVNGEAKGMRITVCGFWDGGDYWRVRFAPPKTGGWAYESRSADRGMNGVKGFVHCTGWSEKEKIGNPARRGFIRVAREGERKGRYFEYPDGVPFFWMADIWSYWTKKGIHFSSFRHLVDDRAAKGFTVGMMRFPGNGRGNPLDSTYNRIDIGRMREIDGMAAYANSKGLTVWVLFWWGGAYIASIDKEKVFRWSRYLIHRFGAYNVAWIAAGEYNLNDYGGLGIDYWKALARFIKEEDPYGHIVGMHHTPPGWRGGAEAPQWSTAELLHDEPYLDFNQTQVGHDKWRNELIPVVIARAYSKAPSKPIICSEPWIEFKKHATPAEDVRFGAWSAVLSGAAGHTYGGGGVWIANVPEAPVEPFSYDQDWYHKALDYPGAIGASAMVRFISRLEWWRLEPHPELVEEYPQGYCGAIPGEEYVIYLRWGGSCMVNLSDAGPGMTFAYTWYNPRTGDYIDGGVVEGGNRVRFSAPRDETDGAKSDWTLHIKRR